MDVSFCTCVYMHVDVCVCPWMSAKVILHMCACVCLWVCAGVWIHVRVHVQGCVQISVCMSVLVSSYACACTGVHQHCLGRVFWGRQNSHRSTGEHRVGKYSSTALRSAQQPTGQHGAPLCQGVSGCWDTGMKHCTEHTFTHSQPKQAFKHCIAQLLIR